MKQTFLNLTIVLMFGTLLLSSCEKEKEDKGGSDQVTNKVTNKVTSISLDADKQILKIGDSFRLKATISPSNASNTSITWSSSDATVASVSSIGEVKGLAAGKSTITATTEDGGHTATCSVTVNLKNTVTDIDGNTYKTVIIGTQTWMAENLKVTQYADGTAIPHVTGNTAWADLVNNNNDKAYCFYNNDASLGYGALYTYAAATNGDISGTNVQGVCPAGWHLPSDAEWTVLETYLSNNGYNYDGSTGLGDYDKVGKALAAANGWSPHSREGAVGNTDYPTYRNKSGFTALPGGSRGSIYGTFGGAKSKAHWWSSTEDFVISEYNGYARSLCYYKADVGREGNKKSSGLSVRCVKN